MLRKLLLASGALVAALVLVTIGLLISPLPHTPHVGTAGDFLVREVHARLPGVRVVAPEATYLAWLDCRETGLPDPCAFFLEHAKVALNDGRLFGPGGDGFVRLNFGCPRALLADALARMARALAAHAGATR